MAAPTSAARRRRHQLGALSTGAAFGASACGAPTSAPVQLAHQPGYYSTIRFPDVNGDGRADVCEPRQRRTELRVSSGAAFGAVSLLIPNFSDAGGWNAPQYYENPAIRRHSTAITVRTSAARQRRHLVRDQRRGDLRCAVRVERELQRRRGW